MSILFVTFFFRDRNIYGLKTRCAVSQTNGIFVSSLFILTDQTKLALICSRSGVRNANSGLHGIEQYVQFRSYFSHASDLSLYAYCREWLILTAPRRRQFGEKSKLPHHTSPSTLLRHSEWNCNWYVTSIRVKK